MHLTYLLSNDAHACERDGDVVVLDVHSGKYVELTEVEAAACRSFVEGWRLGEDDHNDVGPLAQASATNCLRSLAERGVLTTQLSLGKEFVAAGHVMPTDSVAAHFSEHPPRIRLPHILVFLLSLASSALSMRFMPLRRIMGGVIAGRSKHAAALQTLDIDKSRTLLSIYNRLRLCTFSAREACFLDSLTLLRFLSYFGVHPRWVFGIETAPFRAHCWVQQDYTVFNDTPEYVSAFTPILVV